MKEKCGDCVISSPTDDDKTGETRVCYYQHEYQRVSANQAPRHVDSDGKTCFRERVAAIDTHSRPHTSWWRLIKSRIMA